MFRAIRLFSPDRAMSFSSESQESMLHQIKQKLSLSCPARLKDSFTERRVNITRIVLLALLVIMPIGMLVRYFARGNFHPLDFVILAATLLAYLSACTRYYAVGAVFLVFVICLAAYFGALLHIRGGTQDVTSWLVWLVLPLLITPLLFPWRAMVVVAPIPAMFLLVFILRERPSNWGALMAVLTTGALIGVVLSYAHDVELRLICEQNAKLLKAYDETLQGWAKILEARDKETKGHSERVTALTLKLAKAMGIQDPDTLRFIRYGSLLHDIGKLAIPNAILNKPGPLTPDEQKIIEQHTEYAYEWLKDVEFLRPTLDIPRYHHEKWDGTGYPHGLKGEQIPLSARIFAVADNYDALISNRVYRNAWPPAQAIEYIKGKAGTDFDSQVVEKFLEIVQGS